MKFPKRLSAGFLTFMAVTAVNSTSAAPLSDQFVECRDPKIQDDEEILFALTPETGSFFFYSSDQLANGLSDQVARGLQIRENTDRLSMQIAPSKFCTLHNESTTIGIQTIRCTIGKGSTLKIHQAGAASEKVIALVGGTIQFHRNVFYEGSSNLGLDLITADGKGVSVRKNMTYEGCHTEGL